MAEVVVDVEHGGELVAAGEMDADDEVLPVTEDVPHRHRPPGLGLPQPGEPLGQVMVTPGQGAGRPAAADLVGCEHGEGGEQRRRLREVHVRERPDQHLGGEARSAGPPPAVVDHGGEA